jgi:hypothetical protein
MLTTEQRDKLEHLAGNWSRSARLFGADDGTAAQMADDFEAFAAYLDTLTAPEWTPTDAELTTIYKTANNELGKGRPITTQRIFTAMRAMLAAKPGDSNAPEKSRSQRLTDAGFTRRPTWRSLPKDGDAESDKETGGSDDTKHSN